jgi:hypothetical protein
MKPIIMKEMKDDRTPQHDVRIRAPRVGCTERIRQVKTMKIHPMLDEKENDAQGVTRAWSVHFKPSKKTHRKEKLDHGEQHVEYINQICSSIYIEIWMCSSLAGCQFENSGDVFTCIEHNTVHICGDRCSERFVNKDTNSTCKISGRCFHQMIATHPFERIAKFVDVDQAPPLSKTTARRSRNPFLKTGEELRQISSNIIHRLLFGHRRNTLARQRMDTIKLDVEKAIALRQRKKRAMTKPEIDSLVSYHLQECHIVPIKASDMDKVQYFSKIVLDAWSAMAKSAYGKQNRAHIHFQAHVLGCLYLLPYGIKKNGVIYLPQEDYLLSMLPPINDIRKIGFPTKEVTLGKNHLLKCYSQQAASSNSNGEIYSLHSFEDDRA